MSDAERVELPNGADEWPRDALVARLAHENRMEDLRREIDTICDMDHDTTMSTHPLFTKEEIATVLVELGWMEEVSGE